MTAAGFAIDTLNIGGGFGAFYAGDEAPLAAEYATEIVPLLRGKGLRIFMEPGRSITANAGILVTRTQYIKSSGDKQFVIVDAAMNDLFRPALYEAYHFIWPVSPGPEAVPTSRSNDAAVNGAVEVDVVGPICESGDFLGKARRLPPVDRGDLLAVFSAGAYGLRHEQPIQLPPPRPRNPRRRQKPKNHPPTRNPQRPPRRRRVVGSPSGQHSQRSCGSARSACDTRQCQHTRLEWDEDSIDDSGDDAHRHLWAER